MNLRKSLAGFVATALLTSMPIVASADDPTATPDHSGKQADGKTNGVSPSTAKTVQKQEKEQPAVRGDPGAADAPAAAPK